MPVPNIATWLALLAPLCAAFPGHSTQAYNDTSSLLWGPYRPNLYIGLRPRLPDSLLMGFMWAEIGENGIDPKAIRHTCEQKEGMAGYGWTSYDPRMGGTQVMNDTKLGLDVIADFVKGQGKLEGSKWKLEVNGVPQQQSHVHDIITVFYIGTESSSPQLICDNDPGDRTSVVCTGEDANLGKYSLRIKSADATFISAYGFSAAPDSVWQAESYFMDQLKSSHYDASGSADPATFLPSQPREGNLQFISAFHEGSFGVDVTYEHESAEGSTKLPSAYDLQSRFESQFQSVYKPNAPFKKPEHTRFAQAMLANLLGGIAYFHGTEQIFKPENHPHLQEKAINVEKRSSEDRKKAAEEKAKLKPVDVGPYQLTSAVPSRPFFPRGFLWDEGFHLEVMIDWDLDLALDVVTSWFALMDEDGWIAREQILGPEARSKVPSEFQVQDPHYANPPTLFTVIGMFADRLHGQTPYHGRASHYLRDKDAGLAWLENIYPKMKLHFDWWTRTQSGNLRQYQQGRTEQFTGYRWRGRTNQLTLTSGLDDYPRASEASTEELHVDALSWVFHMGKVMEQIGEYVRDHEGAEMFEMHQKLALKSMDALHWSEADQAYCDLTINEGHVEHVCHKGYVSLTPFLNGMVGPDHPYLGSVLQLMQDPTHLWTNYGLRSLSKSDSYSGTGDNYWRSPIWVNINYMALKRLLEIANASGPHREQARKMYSELRLNIVNTVYNSWWETGFAWEQYNPDTGKGQRTQHFTGWTSLVVRIMAMPNIGGYSSSLNVGSYASSGLGLNSFSLFLFFSLMLVIFLGRRRIMTGINEVMQYRLPSG